jgi:hypothetical protein
MTFTLPKSSVCVVPSELHILFLHDTRSAYSVDPTPAVRVSAMFLAPTVGSTNSQFVELYKTKVFGILALRVPVFPFPNVALLVAGDEILHTVRRSRESCYVWGDGGSACLSVTSVPTFMFLCNKPPKPTNHVTGLYTLTQFFTACASSTHSSPAVRYSHCRSTSHKHTRYGTAS